MKLLLLACATLALTADGHEIRRLLEDAGVRTAVDKLRLDGAQPSSSPASFKDVAVDVDDERFLQITQLRVAGGRLEGDFRMVSNALAEDFRGDGHFSAPEAVVSLSRNLGPALVCAVRFFSDTEPGPEARRRLDAYLRKNGVEPEAAAEALAANSTAELVAAEMYERLMGEDLDRLADFLLDVVRRKIRDAGHDEMDLPDLDCLRRRRRHHRGQKVFYAAGGVLKGVSRLARAGPATVRREGSVIAVACPLRLDRLELRYEAYGLQLSRLKVASGAVKGSVRASTVDAGVAVGVAGDGCGSAAVRQLRLSSAGEVRLRLGGLPAAHPTVARIGECFADLFRESVAPRVERVLRDAVAETLHEFRCPR